MSLLTNLSVYYKLDEASGNALDAQGSNDLADNNLAGSAAGKVGNARSLSGGSFFSLASNATLQAGDVDFTWQAWVKLTTKSATMSILTKDNNAAAGNHEYNVEYSASADRFRFQVFRPTDVSVRVVANTFGSPSTGTWYLIHGWHDAAADTIGIAVNAGTPDTLATGGALQAAGPATFEMGARELSGSPQYFDGLIDEAGLWKNRVLTAQDRTDLYNGGAGLAYSSFGGSTGGPFPWFADPAHSGGFVDLGL